MPQTSAELLETRAAPTDLVLGVLGTGLLLDGLPALASGDSAERPLLDSSAQLSSGDAKAVAQSLDEFFASLNLSRELTQRSLSSSPVNGVALSFADGQVRSVSHQLNFNNVQATLLGTPFGLSDETPATETITPASSPSNPLPPRPAALPSAGPTPNRVAGSGSAGETPSAAPQTSGGGGTSSADLTTSQFQSSQTTGSKDGELPGKSPAPRSGPSLTPTNGGDSGGSMLLMGEGCGEEPPPNTPPVAVDDQGLFTSEDNAATLDVLSNDFDSDGHNVFITNVTQGGLGRVTFNASEVIYTPHLNEHGGDSFQYTIKDGHGGEATATAYVTILLHDDDPVAVNDFETTTEGGFVEIDVLGNDSDVEGSVTLVSVDAESWQYGTITDNGNGTVTYEPFYYVDPETGAGSGFSGWDYFNYEISDETGNTAAGSVEIYVYPAYPDPYYNVPAWTNEDTFDTEEDGPFNFQVAGLLSNDFDPDSPIELIGLDSTSSAGGSITDNGDGLATYAPPLNYHGLDSFQYQIDDGAGNSTYGYVRITVAPVNDSPVGVNDVAYTGFLQPISIFVLNNDTDIEVNDPWDPEAQLLIVTNAVAGLHGTVTFDGNAINYQPHEDFISGSDTISYEVKDGHGGTSSASVTIHVVEVTDYTLEWQDPDENWLVVPSGEVVWSHDTLRWSNVIYGPDPPGGPTQTDWAAKDWELRDDPCEPWTTFAIAPNQDPAIGNPGAGIWAITPQLMFDNFQHQTGFVAMMAPPALNAKGERIDAEIQSIKWTTHSEANQAGKLINQAGDNSIFYPDALIPSDPIHKKVDIEIQITPQREGITIWLNWYDVDDPTDSDGPIDPDPDVMVTSINNNDNYVTGIGAEAALAPSATTDNAGKIRETFQINWIQPGNNFRIAASPHLQELVRTQALADDLTSSLFYDHNEDGFYDNSVHGPSLDENSTFKGIGVTPLLTVWRVLHIEVDSMGTVVGNKVSNTVVDVRDNGDGTSTVTLANALDPDDVTQNRFQGGNLHDVMGNDFEIISNTATTILVKSPVGPGLPIVQNGLTIISDDDEWQDGEDVPMPDTSEVESAFEKAFATVLYVDPAENPNPTVPFRQHLETSEDVENVMRYDMAGHNSTSYWAGYLLAAFQGPKNRDNDFDDELTASIESPVLGETYRGLGMSIIYMETDHDSAREDGYDVALNEQDTVVHELGHLVSQKSHEDITVPMTGAPVTWSRFTEPWLKAIRETDKPAG